MSKAQAEKVAADPDGARELLDSAREHAEDAGRSVNSASGRYLLAYQGALDAMNAILKAAGYRITSGLAGHMVRIEKCSDLLPSDSELFERVDDARQMRNKLSYDGGGLSVDAVEEFVDDLQKLIEVAEAALSAWEAEDDEAS